MCLGGAGRLTKGLPARYEKSHEDARTATFRAGVGGIILGDCPLMSRIGAKRNPRQPEHGAPLKYIPPLYIIPSRTCHAKSKPGVVVGHREAVQRR